MIEAKELKVGDIFLVLPGESIPTDGIIVHGRSTLDESPVTGESLPVEKGVGEQLFCATINLQAPLQIQASIEFTNNTLSRIITLVESAQEQKGRAQEWMERFGQKYSPAVLFVALLFLLYPLLFDASSAYWIEKAVILLVAAAPCALVISLPIAMAAGISGSAKEGILIKGGAHLEHLGVIKNIALDKTGTLTYGKPKVTQLMSLDMDEDEMLSIAAGLEHYSTHPLAQAITEYASDKKLKIPKAEEIETLFGSGIEGIIDTQHYSLASPSYFQELGYDLEELQEQIAQAQSEGKTVVLLGSKQKILGLIAIEDKIRENATKTIEKLHALGITITMLTGDNEKTAKRVAQLLNIDNIHANLKPHEKVEVVKELMKDGPTLMVGDGVNDAPALATATCGVAMGVAGTDAAIEAADVALMADDLEKLYEAIHIGRKAREVSRQNIIFAILILLILIPAGVSGLISVALTVFVHEASELLAVANGLRAAKVTVT